MFRNLISKSSVFNNRKLFYVCVEPEPEGIEVQFILKICKTYIGLVLNRDRKEFSSVWVPHILYEFMRVFKIIEKQFWFGSGSDYVVFGIF